MNLVLIILLIGITATSFMTAFSYTWSKIFDKQFKEPQLINSLINKSPLLKINPSKGHPLGWIIHYLIGIGFVFFLVFMWTNNLVEPTWILSCFVGAILGLIGVLGWRILFYIHTVPPAINHRKFYMHLIIAHIIFVCIAIASWRILT